MVGWGGGSSDVLEMGRPWGFIGGPEGSLGKILRGTALRSPLRFGASGWNPSLRYVRALGTMGGGSHTLFKRFAHFGPDAWAPHRLQNSTPHTAHISWFSARKAAGVNGRDALGTGGGGA